jgi:hypothetical protein
VLLPISYSCGRGPSFLFVFVKDFRAQLPACGLFRSSVMSNHSSDSIVPQHEHGLSGATEFSGSLTQTNLQNIDFIGSRV